MSLPTDWRKEWGVLLLAAFLALPLFTPRLYAADEAKYVTHLRSVYFDGDLDYGNDYRLLIERDPEAHGWLSSFLDHPTSTGRYLNDAPIGSAVLWSPFFMVADGAVVVARALGSDVPRTGLSAPYVWAISFGSLFWGLVGLALCYRCCRLFHDRRSSQRAILGVWFSSSLVFYLYITPPMAHATSVFAVALFTWLWLRGRERERSLRDWTLLGASAGLAVLVRELNWLMLAPLAVDEAVSLAGVVRRGELRNWSARVPGYAAFCAVLGVVVLPQFLVYQALHGSFSPTPFVVEKLSYPQFVPQVLFSGFHGLFSWTPITLLATVGLGILGRRHPVVAAGFAAAFLAQLLVVGSYATWWGGASFGARRFLNCTPMFAVGLAALLSAVPAARQRFATAALVALTVWNFGLAVQYAVGIIPRDEPVTMREIAVNQFTEVPPRLAGVASRFLFDRWSLVENRPGRDS